MRNKTLSSVPTATLAKWRTAAVKAFGDNCPQRRVYDAELQRRAAAKGKGVNHGR